MKYPGRIVKIGESDAGVVKAIKIQLNRVLALQRVADLKLNVDESSFGPRMKQAVQLFQARNVDATGHPLRPDGAVGAVTWAALFGSASVPSSATARDWYLASVLEFAATEEARGVREQPRNSNRGPEVEQYLHSVGLGPGFAWCCAFVYWCFDQAGLKAHRTNPMFKTAGCLAHWNNAPAVGARRITRSQAIADIAQIQPGMVFIMDFGAAAGHTGLVESVGGGLVVTIEGNTDASMTREGGGVYRLRRKITDINKGFIDYAAL